MRKGIPRGLIARVVKIKGPPKSLAESKAINPALRTTAAVRAWFTTLALPLARRVLADARRHRRWPRAVVVWCRMRGRSFSRSTPMPSAAALVEVEASCLDGVGPSKRSRGVAGPSECSVEPALDESGPDCSRVLPDEHELQAAMTFLEQGCDVGREIEDAAEALDFDDDGNVSEDDKMEDAYDWAQPRPIMVATGRPVTKECGSAGDVATIEGSDGARTLEPFGEDGLLDEDQEGEEDERDVGADDDSGSDVEDDERTPTLGANMAGAGMRVFERLIEEVGAMPGGARGRKRVQGANHRAWRERGWGTQELGKGGSALKSSPAAWTVSGLGLSVTFGDATDSAQTGKMRTVMSAFLQRATPAQAVGTPPPPPPPPLTSTESAPSKLSQDLCGNVDQKGDTSTSKRAHADGPRSTSQPPGSLTQFLARASSEGAPPPKTLSVPLAKSEKKLSPKDGKDGKGSVARGGLEGWLRPQGPPPPPPRSAGSVEVIELPDGPDTVSCPVCAALVPAAIAPQHVNAHFD